MGKFVCAFYVGVGYRGAQESTKVNYLVREYFQPKFTGSVGFQLAVPHSLDTLD